ncbi:MAG: hypothetical protein GY841_19985 [FCB group bacterium]|nr:hypothetical protein [FCB group bacterium]
MRLAACNWESGAWEPIGAVHPPHMPLCGAKPEGMGKRAVCDAETGKWRETCDREPPADIKKPFCDESTDTWVEEESAVPLVNPEDPPKK